MIENDLTCWKAARFVKSKDDVSLATLLYYSLLNVWTWSFNIMRK